MVSHVVIKGFVWLAMLLLKDLLVSHVVKDLYG